MNSETKKVILEVAPGALSDYYDWAKDAQHGDVLVYWTGDLQFDRSVIIPTTDLLRQEERQKINALNTIANRVYDESKAGNVRLTQRRIAENVFEYRAHRVRIDYPGTKQTVRNDDLVPA